VRYAIKSSIVIFALILFFSSAAFSQEEIQYRRFKLEKASCDVGLLYRNTTGGMDIAVSAIATGKGAEFRKWTISDIKLNIGGERIRPDRSGKFYTTEESFFRIPAAILFAAIGTQIDVSGSGLEKGIAKAGMAIGLGLLVLQARGEIAGENCVFNLSKDRVDRIEEGADAIDIIIENTDMHFKDTVKIGIAKAPSPAEVKTDRSKLSQDELLKKVDTLEGEVRELEKEQGPYKYGSDPQYDVIQRKIETLQTERALAYKTWFERNRDRSNKGR